MSFYYGALIRSVLKNPEIEFADYLISERLLPSIRIRYFGLSLGSAALNLPWHSNSHYRLRI
jgi:hypothetical protein